MRVTAEQARHLRLLEWLAEQGKQSVGMWDVLPFYQALPNPEKIGDLPFHDSQQLNADGLINYYRESTGRVVAELTSAGRSKVQELEQRWADKTERNWACRSAIIRWLYDQDVLLESQARSIFGFETESKADYLGKPFGIQVVQQAVRWLADNGLIDGVETAESGSLIRAYLTASGVKCAERFGSDTRQYAELMDTPSIVQNLTFNNSGHVQLAMGPNSTLSMDLGTVRPEVQELIAALDGLMQLVRPIVEDAELETLYKDAVVDITTLEPTGTALRRTLARAKELVAKSENASLVALVTMTTSGLVTKADHLFGLH